MTTAFMNNLNAKGARFAGVMISLVGALLMSLDPIFFYSFLGREWGGYRISIWLVYRDFDANIYPASR